MNAKLFFLLFFFLLITPRLMFAQEEGRSEEKHTAPLIEQTTSFKDSIYSLGIEDDAELSPLEETPLSSPFSSVDPLRGNSSLMDKVNTSQPIKRPKEKINSLKQHDQHSKQHVEESLHEWVSPNVKGHKVAITITVISGLAFLGLSLFRIGEKH
jgi:hypothetical protein